MINLLVAGVFEIASYIRRNSKIVYFLFLLFLFCIISGNTTSNDRTTYNYIYSNTHTLVVGADIEVGFQILMLSAKQLGFSFRFFCSILALIVVTLYGVIIKRLAINPSIVIGAYFLYPFVLDAEQLRTALGHAIVLLGITYLIEKKAEGVKVYIICCILASLIHTSCFFFLLYLLIRIEKKYINIITLVACGMLVTGREVLLYIADKISYINMDKVNNYFMETNAKNDVGVYLLYNIILLLIVLYFACVKKNTCMLPLNEQSNNSIVWKLNVLSFFYVALLLINPNFERLLRPIFLLDYIFLSNLLPKKINRVYQLFIWFFLLIFPGVRLIAFFTGGGFESLIKPMFYEGFSIF